MADTPHDERAHSVRSPSKAGIFTNCLGAPRLWEQVGENPSSQAARLGTAKHTLTEKVFQTSLDAADFLGETLEVEGENYEVDEDFAKDVQMAFDMAWEVIGPDDGKLLLELEVPLSHIIGPDEKGHVDLLYISWERKKVFVLDHKFGRKKVDAKNNPSLLLYASGALRYAGLLEKIENFDFVLGILQPIQGVPVTWELTGTQMKEELEALKETCAKTYEPDAPFVPGNHCFFCAGKPICPEMAQKVGSMVFDDPGFDNLDAKTPEAYTAEDIAKILPLLDTVEKWATDLREYWKQQWLDGTEIPGWKVIPGRNGARQWADKDAVEELLINKFRMPAKEVYDQKLITPTTAEKLLADKSPRRWTQLQELITQKPTAPTLAPADNPAPPMERASEDCPFI